MQVRVDEEMAANSLVDFLVEKVGVERSQVSLEAMGEHDPPDYWLVVEGFRCPVEVTQIVTEATMRAHGLYRAFVKKLDAALEQQHGSEVSFRVSIIGKPSLPKMHGAFDEVVGIAAGSLSLVRELGQQETIYQDEEGGGFIRATAERLCSCRAKIGGIGGGADFNHALNEELRDLIITALTSKKEKLSRETDGGR